MKKIFMFVIVVTAFVSGCASVPAVVKQKAEPAAISGRPDPASLPEAVTVTANAAIFSAAASGDAAVLSAIISSGANLNVKTDDKLQMTPLMKAAEAGKKEALRLLVEGKAPVNTVSRFGFTALMFASQSGSMESVKYLIEKGADVNITGHMWSTALRWAEKEEIREILKKAGAR